MKIKRTYLFLFCFFIIFHKAQSIKDTTLINTIDTVLIRKVKNEAKKSTFFFNKSRFIENTKLSEAITSIGNVTIGNDKSIIYKGNKIEQVLINGIKSSMIEFNALRLEDILSIEIIYNHIDSSSGEGLLTLNVKSRQKPGIKGYIDFSPGAIQDFFYEGLGVSVKTDLTLVSFSHTNLWNSNRGTIIQKYLNNNFEFKTKRNLYQPYNSLTITHNLKENQSISMRLFYSGIKEKSESLYEEQIIKNNMKMNSYNANLLYDWKSSNYSFELNSDFIVNNNKYQSTNFSDNKSQQIFKEFAISPYLTKKIKNGTLEVGFTYTHRHFQSNNSLNDLSEKKTVLNQNIYNLILSSDYNISKNLSLSTALRFQKYNDAYINDNILLPYIKVSQKFEKIASIDATYRKRVYRPNSYSLLGGTYQEINGSITNSNPNLVFQTSEIIDLSITPKLSKGSISFGGTYEDTRNQIKTSKNIDTHNYLLINSIVNLNSNEKRLNLSLSYPLSDKININSYYKYIFLKNLYENQIFKDNYQIFGLSLNGTIFKEYNISLNSDYRSKIYDANYFIKLKPDFSITISHNFFKNLLYTSLELRNLLDNDSKREFIISDKNNQFLKNNSYYNSRLFLLTLSYNFGKNFNSRMKNVQPINNDLINR